MGKLKQDKGGFSLFEVLLIIVVIAAMGAIGWLVYKSHHKTTTAAVANVSTTKSTASSSTSTASSNPYAGWVNYSSSIGNYSFMYPSSGWTIGPNTDVGGEENILIQENNGQSTGGNGYAIDVQVLTNDDKNALGPYDSAGTVTKLSNGLDIWQSDNNGGLCVGNFLVLVSGQNNYLPLSNGKYFTFSGTFCQSLGNGNTESSSPVSYDQAVNSNEAKVTKEILASFTFK